MPRFAYLFSRFPSFTQTFCVREVAEMVRQGANPLIFSIRKEEPAQSHAPEPDVHYIPHIRRIERLKMRWSVPWRMRGELQRWSRGGDLARFYQACYLAPILRREGVRHVHAHFAGMAARTAWWLKKLAGVSFSFTGHANDMFCETDHPVSLEELVREAGFVVTETDFSRDWLREKFPQCGAKIHRVYNGIDVARFQPGEPCGGHPLILSVGRLIGKKGFADLIEACRLLRGRGVGFECRIAGGGPLGDALRGQIARGGLKDCVFLDGPLTQAELAPLFGRASLFVLACTHESGGGMDNLPTVIAEAMACALPVVSTRVAGVPEMVADGGSGFLVSEKNPAELSEAMAKMLADPACARRFGLHGRAVARGKFSIEHSARQLRELIDSALVTKPESPPVRNC